MTQHRLCRLCIVLGSDAPLDPTYPPARAIYHVHGWQAAALSPLPAVVVADRTFTVAAGAWKESEWLEIQGARTQTVSGTTAAMAPSRRPPE